MKKNNKVYLIVNDKIQQKVVSSVDIITENGLKYYREGYGNGEVHWPIISSPKEAYDRAIQENVLWAEQRLEWAKKHSKEEVPELEDIIKKKGTNRLIGCLKNFKRIKEK
jgi:hypothetical protein